MRRSRVVDRVLLATLLPAYLVIQGVAVRDDLALGFCWYGFGFTGAQGASGHPLVVWDAGSPLRVGDQLLRFAQLDLRGLSASQILHATVPLLRGGRPFQVEAERSGEPLELTVTPTCDPYWWWRIAVTAILALAATFLFLRPPHSHLARRFFAASLFSCMSRAIDRSFNGDGMMAVFGAPEALARKEQQAVEAARRIVDSMPATLAVGVGVATGDAFVGSIRSTDRLIWSAVGSTTNLASRLQSLRRELSASIAIDETTRTRAGYVCADFVRNKDVAIRGRTGRFEVFALPLKEGGLEDATSRAASS